MLSARSAASRSVSQHKIRRLRPAQASNPSGQYFVATNNFKVKPEFQETFEQVWKTRETHLKEVPGFIRFALLKCSNVPGEYISQSHWESEQAFKQWTQSPQFAKSHSSQSSQPPANGEAPKRPAVAEMLLEPPMPKMYDTVTITEFTQ